ncbi:MAG: iron ABC transporter permease [Oscillospiraceae bacterium]|nr:iron ABC transporter permease [Oscillospiraceae bacterium]
MDPRKKQYIVAYLLLTLALLVLLALGLLAGSTRIPAGDVVSALFKPAADGMSTGIVRNIRLPRALAAVLLGGALSVAGFLLQTFFGNPIAGPFVLGISSGAKLTVALTMIFCLSHGILLTAAGMIGAAFLGAMLAMSMILLASNRLRGMSLLIVCGVMIGYICSAITEIAVTFADDSNIVNLHYWSMGSFSGIGWGDLSTAALVVLGAFACSILLAKPMDAYRLGEAYAGSMGVNVKRFRAELILLSSLLAATVTAFAGPISFVGIAVPHLIKGLFRSSKPLLLLPACFLGGGAFCLFCDLIARTLFAPTELSISSVTAVFGAPVVIWMLLNRRKGERT